MKTFLRVLAATSCLVAIAACGDDNVASRNTTTDTVTPTRSEVVRYETTGGCQMMGPNCATYVVYSDGTVEIHRAVDIRPAGQGAPAEIVGAIPAAEVSAFLDSVKDTDFSALLADVGPGTCNSCVDGIDIVLTLGLGGEPVVLDSTVINFDINNDFFANVETLMNDVRAVGELPLQQRG